jgi:hypothetical protein
MVHIDRIFLFPFGGHGGLSKSRDSLDENIIALCRFIAVADSIETSRQDLSFLLVDRSVQLSPRRGARSASCGGCDRPQRPVAAGTATTKVMTNSTAMMVNAKIH